MLAPLWRYIIMVSLAGTYIMRNYTIQNRMHHQIASWQPPESLVAGAPSESPSSTRRTSVAGESSSTRKILPYNSHTNEHQAGEFISSNIMNHYEETNGQGTRTRDPPNRMLLGIFSTSSEQDAMRRRLIRKTYLSNYAILDEVGLASESEGKINERLCSLADLQGAKRNLVQECLIVYTFVIGAWDRTNTTALTDLTGIDDPTYPFVVNDAVTNNSNEEDILQLNIRENMNYGKSNTWFRYASTMLPQDFGIDLVAKVDTDTVLFPRSLLEDLNSHVPRRPAIGLYGGFSEVVHPKEPSYMQGGFYFISRDVAKHITSKECPRSQVISSVAAILKNGHGRDDIDRAEDVEIGNFIDHCWNNRAVQSRRIRTEDKSYRRGEKPIKKIFLDPNVSGYHDFHFKKSRDFRIKWKQGLAKEIAQLRRRQINGKYPQGCPISQVEMDEELRWFDNRPHALLAKDRFARFCRRNEKRKARVEETPKKM